MNFKQIWVLCIFAYLSSFNSRAQEITMFPGFWDFKYYQDDERISKKDLKALLITNDEVYSHWRKSKTMETISLVALASEIGFVIWELSDRNNVANNTATQIGVYGSFAVGITFAILSNGQKKKAILKYNQSLEKKSAFKILPSKTGVGLVLQF